MRRRRSTSYYTPRRSYYDTRRQPRRRRRGSSPWPRLFYGVTVLAGGITGAWHYHKTAAPAAQPTTVAQASATDENITLQLVAPTPVVPEAPWDAPQTSDEPDTKEETPKAPRASLDSAASPPNLAAAFEPLTISPTRKAVEAVQEKSHFEPVPEPTDSEDGSNYESNGKLQDDEPGSDVKEVTEPLPEDEEAEEEEKGTTDKADNVEDSERLGTSNSSPPSKTISDARPRQHRVVDGDTLASLAEKYLGHADQWRIIYDANRSLLSSSEWLPVGVTLTIPVAEPKKSGGFSPATDMVPVPTDLLYGDSKN